MLQLIILQLIMLQLIITLLFCLFKNYYYKILIENNITNYSFQEYENDIKDAISYIPFFYIYMIWLNTKL